MASSVSSSSAEYALSGVQRDLGLQLFSLFAVSAQAEIVGRFEQPGPDGPVFERGGFLLQQQKRFLRQLGRFFALAGFVKAKPIDVAVICVADLFDPRLFQHPAPSFFVSSHIVMSNFEKAYTVF